MSSFAHIVRLFSDTLVLPSKTDLIAQRFAAHQNRLHPVLGLLQAAKFEEGCAFDLEGVLFADGRDRRAYAAGEHAGEVASDYAIMGAEGAELGHFVDLLL